MTRKRIREKSKSKREKTKREKSKSKIKTSKPKTNKTKKISKISKINEFHKLSCSPTRKNKEKGKGKGYSCYSDSSLQHLKKMWNLRHPDDRIDASDAREIWQNLKNNMRGVCSEEACWMRQEFVKNNITPEMLHYTFVPAAPDSWKKNKNTWLTSTDISRVMLQYEKEYPDFVFIGPSPIDFNSTKYNNTCVWDDLCKFSLATQLKNNKSKIGVIFNLDKHWQGGSHWVALFIDCSKKIIFYFDSTGDAIPKEIKVFVDRVMKQGKEMTPKSIDFKYDDSKNVEHQLDDTECGVYCLHFIISILRNKKTFADFKNKLVRDNEMEKCRKYFFNIL